MADATRTHSAHQLESLCRQFGADAQLPFAPLLSVERIDVILQEENAAWRDCRYSPALTLWAFLSQCLCPDGSCRKAVARVLAWLLSHGEKACSAKTDPYCKARQRLPLSLFTRLTRATGRDLAQQLPDAWRGLGHRGNLIDGSTVSMPDTPELQQAFPQNPRQAAGVGFPIARMVVVCCLVCGSALDA